MQGRHLVKFIYNNKCEGLFAFKCEERLQKDCSYLNWKINF